MRSRKRKAFRDRFREMPLWAEILLHIAAVGLGLVLFALPHHVIGYEMNSLGIESKRGGTINAEQIAAEAIQGGSDPATGTTLSDMVSEGTAAEEVGRFDKKFADKFISGPAVSDATSYVSENLNIQIKAYYENKTRFYVADIYVRDISCVKRAFAQEKFGRSITENIVSVAQRENSVLTMSGDYYGLRDGGIVLANGTLYKSELIYNDICVLYWDGTVKCFHKENFNADTEIANGAYQAWNFGPYLLDENGQALAEFPSRYDDVQKQHPRAAFGYYEPGHYCFVTVDGRQGTSRGITMTNFAKLGQQLGLTQLYNLDGGDTAWMCLGTETVNIPSDDGRNCSDYICIVDEIQR